MMETSITLPSLGTLEELRLLNAGARFDLFSATQGQAQLCLKSPSTQSTAAGYYAAEAYRHESSETFYGGETCDLAETNPAQLAALSSLFLQAEYTHLIKTQGAWNHEPTALSLWDNELAHDTPRAPSRPLPTPRPGAYTAVMRMPFYPGRGLSDFPSSERRALLLEMLPALWDALCAAEHGALSEECLLVSPGLARFRILSPGALLSTTTQHSRGSGSSETHTRCFVKTCAKNYPLLPPFGPVHERLHQLAEFAGRLRNRKIKATPTRLEAMLTVNAFSGAQPSRLHYQSERPQPADLLALGVILYRILTDEELLVGPALLIEYPLWLGQLSSMGRGGLHATNDIEERSEVVREALSDGYLQHRLRRPEISPKEGLLLERLITQEVQSRVELLALL